MQIRRLNPLENPQDLAAIVPAHRQWRDDYLPGFPPFGEARLRLWSMPGYRRHKAVFGVFADEHAEQADGVAVFGYQLDKNLDLASATIAVSAEARARGVETALFKEILRETAQSGRKRLAFGIPETMDPAAFVERHGGATLTDTALSSILDLSTIDRARYEAWSEPSAKNSEYTLVGWVGRCPDELAQSYCTALDAMADQPLGTFEYEFAKNDIERLRYLEDQVAQSGGRLYVQVALDPAGNIAGFNSLMSYPDEPEFADIWDTGVVRAHRGHGLGLRLKAAASLWLLEDRPSARWVGTYNNEDNEWMLAVNRTLGYRDPMPWLGYEFAVAG